MKKDLILKRDLVSLQKQLQSSNPDSVLAKILKRNFDSLPAEISSLQAQQLLNKHLAQLNAPRSQNSLFRLACAGEEMDFEEFRRLCKQVGLEASADQIRKVFFHMSEGRATITSSQFQAFSSKF